MEIINGHEPVRGYLGLFNREQPEHSAQKYALSAIGAIATGFVSGLTSGILHYANSSEAGSEVDRFFSNVTYLSTADSLSEALLNYIPYQTGRMAGLMTVWLGADALLGNSTEADTP